MARHNRDARGSDQRGFDYEISYQPDWVRLIKVTRDLESGRQSTKTLFRNPGYKEQEAGDRVRTRISSAEQELDIEVAVTDVRRVVKRIIIETEVQGRERKPERVVFTVEEDLPPPNGDG